MSRAPRKALSARAKIWRSMRMMRRFTVSDLCATAEATKVNVWQYLEALTRAGYSRCVRQAISRRGHEGQAIYALIKDTGPLAPQRMRDGSIVDPNVVADVNGAGGSGCGNQNGSRGCATNANGPVRPRSRS